MLKPIRQDLTDKGFELNVSVRVVICRSICFNSYKTIILDAGVFRYQFDRNRSFKIHTLRGRLTFVCKHIYVSLDSISMLTDTIDVYSCINTGVG